MSKFRELIIKKELLNEFCKINNFIIVTDEMLKKYKMYKNIVYATDNNFVGKKVYPKDMPIIMNKEVWKKLININEDLKKNNYCIKIYDAYRPVEIQKIFWEYFYEKYGYYDENLVANPNKYGTHNIIMNAIDILLSNLDGTNVELPCEYDDFSGKSNILFEDCSEKAKNNRDLLIHTAKKYGLIVNEGEWWHFYDNSLEKYGMNFNYLESELIPKLEEKVFILKTVK